MGGDGAVGQMLRDQAGEAVGAAGGRGFQCLVEAVDEGGGNRLEFRGLKTGYEGAAQLGFADGERGGPLPGLAGDGYGGFAHELERFGGVGARAEERGVLFFGQLGETAMEHREGDLAGEVVEPVGAGLGLGAGRRQRKKRDAGVGHLGIGMKIGAHAVGFYDFAEGGIGPGGAARGEIGELGGDQFLDEGDGDVAHDADGHVLGAIPGVPEIEEALGGAVEMISARPMGRRFGENVVAKANANRASETRLWMESRVRFSRRMSAPNFMPRRWSNSTREPG
jgi:hypothetical protein